MGAGRGETGGEGKAYCTPAGGERTFLPPPDWSTAPILVRPLAYGEKCE